MKTTLLAAGLAVFAMAGPGAAQEVYTLRLADQFPLTHVASIVTVQPFINKLQERSNGRIKIEHYPAQQLVKASGMLEAVRTGVADIAVQVAGQASDRIPLSTVVELPSIGADIEQCYTAFQALADGILQEIEFTPLGVRIVEVQCTPPQFLTTLKPQITSLDDIKGLKVRAGGSVVELVLEQLGATPVNMVAGDIYVALERGALDGAVFAAASSTGYKLQEVVKGVAGNVSWGSNSGVMVMNEAKFQTLPEDLQKLIMEVGREVGRDIAVEYNKGSDKALAELVAGGVTNYDLPPDVVTALKAAQDVVADKWVEQMTARGLPGQQIVDEAKKAAGLTN